MDALGFERFTRFDDTREGEQGQVAKQQVAIRNRDVITKHTTVEMNRSIDQSCQLDPIDRRDRWPTTEGQIVSISPEEFIHFLVLGYRLRKMPNEIM